MMDRLLDYAPPATLLHDKRILVTGAASGIGRAVARSFAGHGASLVLLDKKMRGLETLYDEITGAGDPEPVLTVQDLMQLDHERAMQISAGIEHDLGGLDGLLHNAGELTALTPLHSLDEDSWRRTFHVNLQAPWILTQSLLPLLRRSESASVLFTSASPGRRGEAYWGAYAVAYGGVEILAQTWADELEENTAIRVNTIDPGPVNTAMRRQSFPGEVKGTARLPEDITAAYLYLMGDDSRGIRGQALTI